MKPSYIIQWPGESRFLAFAQETWAYWVSSVDQAERFTTRAAAIQAIVDVRAASVWSDSPLVVLMIY